MDIARTVEEISELTVDERLRIIEAVWDTIASKPEALGLTDVQRAELQRRMSARDANPNDVVSWPEVRARALAGAAK